MEEIKVGEYIRTKNKGICKIDHINEKATVNKYWVNPDYDGWCTSVKTTEIVKHSKNIIDLIEAGDYVNGMEVLEKYIPHDAWEPIELRVDSKYINFIIADEIKTIVTKEMFKNSEYEV